MTQILRGGKVRRYIWTHGGKRHESWGWTLSTAPGKQLRRQGWKSKAEAQEALDAYKAELKNPTPVAKIELTLAQAFEQYFRTKSRKRSLPEDQRLSEHLLLEFGKDTVLTALTASRIAEYKAKRLATTSRQTGALLSAASVNRPLALLRHVLRLAHEEWESLDAIPRVRLEREPEGRLRWLTPEEASRLLDACRESKNNDLADLVELSLFTGLRQSEALGLTWDRVDRARGVIALDITKSGKRREVPLNAGADAVLARRGAKSTGLVFSSRDWDHYRTAWERAIERAKLTDVRWHDLRHTFASWAIQRRVSCTS